MQRDLRNRLASSLSETLDGIIGVAAVQFAPILGDPKANWSTMVELARWSAANYTPLDVIVFPEMALTGYALTRSQALHLAQQPEELTMVSQLAQELGCCIVMGFPGKCSLCPDGTLHNMAGVWHPDGTMEPTYKWNLWGADFYWATSGVDHPQLRTQVKGTSTAVLICKDLRNESPSWVDSDQDIVGEDDVHLTLAPTAWGKGEFPPGAWFDYVAKTKSWLVTANRTGEEPQVAFQGGCMAISPRGQIYHSANPHADKDVLYVHLPLASGTWDRNRYRVFGEFQ